MRVDAGSAIVAPGPDGGGIVIVDESVQYEPQMSLVEKQEVVKAFLAYAAHPTLGDRVRVWRLKWGANDVEPFR